MDLETLKTQYKNDIMAIVGRHGASNVRVFGSVARGDSDEKSDIDLLVHLEPGRSLMDLARINVALEDLLRTKVDLVVDDYVKPALRDNIFNEAEDL